MSSMKPLMTPDQVRKSLEDRNLTIVADRTGLHVSTLYRLRDGEPCSLRTLQVLSEYLTTGKVAKVEVRNG